MKNSMLNIIGILLVVFAAMYILLGFVYMMVSDLMVDVIAESVELSEIEGMEDMDFIFQFLRNIFNFITVYFFVASVIMLIAGIAGIMQRNIVLCWVLGSLCVVVSLILGILYLVATSKLQESRASQLQQQENERYNEKYI